MVVTSEEGQRPSSDTDWWCGPLHMTCQAFTGDTSNVQWRANSSFET